MKKVIALWSFVLIAGSLYESEASVVMTARMSHISYAKPKVYQKKKGIFSFLKRKKKCKCPPLPS
jgi:hypothetical protein